MKVQLLHLSDMHIEKGDDPFKINVDKMIQAITSVSSADECIIVISGDLASSGNGKEYNYVSSLIGAIRKKLGECVFQRKNIEVLCVPGNHDIDFSKMNVQLETIKNAYNQNKINEMTSCYLNNMKGFYGFANRFGCFKEDDCKIISRKELVFDEKKISFVMLNSAPFSLLGGDAQDMGHHFLTDEQINLVEELANANINVLVMHHSIEWFSPSCKEKLRKIISRKYSLVMTGHEHTPVGESRKINGYGTVQCIQGNALIGYAEDGNGFCTVNIDIKNGNMIGYSYIWNKNIYCPKKILDDKAKECLGGELTLKDEFLEEISNDFYKRRIDDYYVFPNLTYNTYTDDDVERHDVESERELLEIIKNIVR